jgi:hypothetical protein
MLRVSDVWERALHARDATVTEAGEMIITQSGVAPHLAELDAFPVPCEPDDP